MASWAVSSLIFVACTLLVNAQNYCSFRSLCPRNEHIGCSFNEQSWRLLREGPIPMKRSSDVGIDERQQIVDMHNNLRRSMAKGENDTNNPPRTISNMRELEWNDQLAYLARVRVTLWSMRSGSDCANLPKYQVGMNQYTQSYPVAPSDSSPWEVVTKYWYSFSKFVSYGIIKDLKAFRDLAQFAQMLWPTTYEIGCASNNFIMPGGYVRNIVCFYGPVARCDDDSNPFSIGEPGSNCTEGTVSKDGLCGFGEATTTSTTTTTALPVTEASPPIEIDPTTEPVPTVEPVEPELPIDPNPTPEIIESTTTPSSAETEPTEIITETEPTTVTTTTEPTATAEIVVTDPTEPINTIPPVTPTKPEPVPPTPTPSSAIDSITPETTPAPKPPCTSTTPVIVPTVDPTEIIISVFRYICQLLSISPSSLKVSVGNGTQLLL